jgi:hypothetical protein
VIFSFQQTAVANDIISTKVPVAPKVPGMQTLLIAGWDINESGAYIYIYIKACLMIA